MKLNKIYRDFCRDSKESFDSLEKLGYDANFSAGYMTAYWNAKDYIYDSLKRIKNDSSNFWCIRNFNFRLLFLFPNYSNVWRILMAELPKILTTGDDENLEIYFG